MSENDGNLAASNGALFGVHHFCCIMGVFPDFKVVDWIVFFVLEKVLDWSSGIEKIIVNFFVLKKVSRQFSSDFCVNKVLVVHCRFR
jgi:hypothetical protein